MYSYSAFLCTTEDDSGVITRTYHRPRVLSYMSPTEISLVARQYLKYANYKELINTYQTILVIPHTTPKAIKLNTSMLCSMFGAHFSHEQLMKSVPIYGEIKDEYMVEIW